MKRTVKSSRGSNVKSARSANGENVLERKLISYTHGFRTSVNERIIVDGNDFDAFESNKINCSDIIQYGIDLSRSVYRRHGIPTGAKEINSCFGRKVDSWLLWEKLSRDEKLISFQNNEKIIETELWNKFKFELGSEPHLASIVMQTSFNLKYYYENRDIEKVAHYAYALSNSIRNLKELTTKVRGRSLGSVISKAIASFRKGEEGGRMGSLKRKRNSAIKKDYCINMAKDIVEANPSMSKANIAYEIMDQREKNGDEKYSHSSILGYLKGVKLR